MKCLEPRITSISLEVDCIAMSSHTLLPFCNKEVQLHLNTNPNLTTTLKSIWSKAKRDNSRASIWPKNLGRKAIPSITPFGNCGRKLGPKKVWRSSFPAKKLLTTSSQTLSHSCWTAELSSKKSNRNWGVEKHSSRTLTSGKRNQSTFRLPSTSPTSSPIPSSSTTMTRSPFFQSCL